jgi:hypothetical protein
MFTKTHHVKGIKIKQNNTRKIEGKEEREVARKEE